MTMSIVDRLNAPDGAGCFPTWDVDGPKREAGESQCT